MTTILIHVKTAGRWTAMEVQASAAFELFGLTFWAHRNRLSPRLWDVSEQQSGGAVVTRRRSRRDAIAAARRTVKEAGEQKTKAAVRHGKMLWRSKADKEAPDGSSFKI